MQVAKRGDAKNRVTIETQNFTVVFSEVGARIQEFRNRDAAYPRRDGANIVIPGTEIYLAPYLGDPANPNLTAYRSAVVAVGSAAFWKRSTSIRAR